MSKSTNLPMHTNVEDECQLLNKIVGQLTDRKTNRTDDYTLDAEMQKAGIALAKLITAKTDLETKRVNTAIDSFGSGEAE